MPIITLFNGRKIIYKSDVSLLKIAKDIKPNLETISVAAFVNGIISNINMIIKQDSHVFIITDQNMLFLKFLRYSCVQLLGYAIKSLWPSARMAISSVTTCGFYYDIDLIHVLTNLDLLTIEKKMMQLAKKNYNIFQEKVSFKEIHNIFEKKNEYYKLNILKKDINSVYLHNLCYHEKYVDLFIGPQLSNIQFCRYFKLQKVSGAYWQGNSNNKMLQRIYGTIWSSQFQLKKYLYDIKVSEKRDHRKIGKKLSLFHIQDDSPGMIFWHSKGWIIYYELEKLIRSKCLEQGYQEVKTPLIMDLKIWKKSGHWENYKDSIFVTSHENKKFCIKPMNCPGHVQIFNKGIRSYRDLPIRISEFGSCHRNEPSGSLHGLMRVKGFTQDDAHIFCTIDQVKSEIHNCITMVYDVYKIFGFKNVKLKISTRPKQRIGSDEEWDRAEQDLMTVLKTNHLPFECQHGEGAFYGPKIEISLKDSLNRTWQCGTVQLDFYLSNRLDAFYINERNERQSPVIIHRALLGSMERFIGILIEEYSGCFPLWLSPVQIMVINISSIHSIYVQKVTHQLRKKGIRAEFDLRNETVGYKIREHTLHHIPYLLICGDKEIQNNLVTIRTRNGYNLGCYSLEMFIEKLVKSIHIRSLNLLEE